MPTRRREAARLAPLAIIAIASTFPLLGAGVAGPKQRVQESDASAWRGLVGGVRPPVSVGQRMIVVLKAPSLADQVASAGGRASDDQERRWTAAAVAAQNGLLSTLAAHGIRLRVEFRYARVINAFAAALDAQAVSLLERQPDVAGVYPVRVAYPASLSSELVERAALARGSADQPQILLPGYDGRGVTIALLDTGIDRAHSFLRGRILDGIDLLGDDYGALAKTKPDDSTRLERHGTEMAGLLVGAGGPAGVTGVATGASVLPIRVAGWQRDLTGGTAVYARTDQLIAGLERAVDPNQDGDAHDAARIALVALAAPYAAFTNGPDANAVEGALQLDTLVVAPAGNDGPAAAGYGNISSPGAAPAAVTVAAADLRRQTEELRVVLRAGLAVLVNRMVPLAGAVLPAKGRELELAAPVVRDSDKSGVNGFRAPAPLGAFFDKRGRSKVAGRAALVPAADDPQNAVLNAVRAGATTVVLYGGALPAGGLGLDESVPVPVVAIPDDAAARALDALRQGRRVSISLGVSSLAANGSEHSIAPFSSRGLAFDGRVKPDLAAPGVALLTSDPGENEDGSPRYATVSGSSAAAATVAGAAALLAQARPALGARELRSLLVGYARPMSDESVRAQGTGLVDIGASAAGEVVATPIDLAFGRARGSGWRSEQTVTLRNVSTRAMRLVVKTPEGGAAGLRLTSSRRQVFLWPGQSKYVKLTAVFRGRPDNSPAAEGAIAFSASGGTPLRIPWAITFGKSATGLLSGLRLSADTFKASDTAPAVLAFQAGRVLGTRVGSAVQPVSRLDVELARPDGTSLGLLVRLRDLLPGRYAFGLTGRDPDGHVLPAGKYELRLLAVPSEGAPATRAAVPFTIK
ncbi:MAG: S8 family serine peptidase [Actinomycetota bacterium]|nr:S8 family serine peptidase [Actinomycetota bacterium]